MPGDPRSRRDPVEILARVGDVVIGAGGAGRAFEVWVHLVRKEGWEVEVIDNEDEWTPGSACGKVSIEGLEYTVYYGLRCRSRGLDDRTIPPTWRPVLNFAAWAEPNLDSYRLE